MKSQKDTGKKASSKIVSATNNTELADFQATNERYDWLLNARHVNQQLTHDLYKRKYHKKDPSQWKMYSVLVASTFSLWRAAPLNKTVKDSDQFREDAYELLNRLVRDNAITYTQDKQLEEWMGGYYMRNCYLRLRQIKKAIQVLDKNIDVSILDNDIFTNLISMKPQKCWTELHELSRSIFDEFAKTLSDK